MLEIRFHGRGGQGTVVATILMAKAFFRAGFQVQSFPFFGVERRGAPVEAYLRLDRQKILLRTNVYNPDHVVVLDKTLLAGIDVTRGLKPGGSVLINSPAPPEKPEAFSRFRLAWVDASRIAMTHQIGSRTHPIVNTSMMGAVARVLGMPPLEDVVAAIREEVPGEAERNVAAAREAFEAVRFVEAVRPAA
ncbi:MAG: pyruvate ferredoxin oxidoreductase [Syntrophaceae bacterium]|nr:pyruvate ferredoxin oxidoreductase [Syntrophaceae bacterium]